MEKKIKLLRILLWIWVALGVCAMVYVLFISKKSNILLAAIFLLGFAAIALPLQKLMEQQKKGK